MAKTWPLDDLACPTDIAEALGVGKAAVCNWPKRYADFPKPLRDLGGRPVYSMKQVTEWHRKRWGW